MKTSFSFLIVILILFGCKNNQAQKNQDSLKLTEPRGVENIAYKWGHMALVAQANDTQKFKPRPTVTSRYLGLIFVSVFDAWSIYDEKAIPVYLEGVDRRSKKERSLKNLLNISLFTRKLYICSFKTTIFIITYAVNEDPNQSSFCPSYSFAFYALLNSSKRQQTFGRFKN